MIDMDWENLGHLNDCFTRADVFGRGSVDLKEFVAAFKDVFPPWRHAVDSNVSHSVLKNMFIRIDANEDGRLSWEEFSSYVLQESMQMSLTGATGIQISLFQDKLPNDQYTDPSAYHKEMIHSVRAVSVQVCMRVCVFMYVCINAGILYSAQTPLRITRR